MKMSQWVSGSQSEWEWVIMSESPVRKRVWWEREFSEKDLHSQLVKVRVSESELEWK